MANNRRFHKKEFKVELCSQIIAGEISKARACREHKLSPTLLDRWVTKYREFGDNAFVEDPEYQKTQEAYVKQLEQALGQAHLELKIVKAALEKKGSLNGYKSPGNL